MLLDAEGITKRFDGITALRDVDLRVDNGEFAAVIGPNGAGKSTLFNCLTGLLRPEEGSMSFDGKALNGVSSAARARLGIGRTFQRVELFGGMTVRDHLIVASRARTRRGALWSDLFRGGGVSEWELSDTDALLETLGLLELADEPAESLPLGTARLVELGRAMVTEPKLLLLDEPSSGLDRSETADMGNTLRRLCDDLSIAIVLIEHDIQMVSQLADSVWVLDYGQLIAHGATSEVFLDETVRTAYLGADV